MSLWICCGKKLWPRCHLQSKLNTEVQQFLNQQQHLRVHLQDVSDPVSLSSGGLAPVNEVVGSLTHLITYPCLSVQTSAATMPSSHALHLQSWRKVRLQQFNWLFLNPCRGQLAGRVVNQGFFCLCCCNTCPSLNTVCTLTSTQLT